MKPVSIGRGLFRITVRSKEKRDRLAKVPGVQVEGARVVFPEQLLAQVKSIVEPPSRPRSSKLEQTDLF